MNSPTVPRPQPSGLSPVLSRNIQSLAQRRTKEDQTASLEDRTAKIVTRFAGSMAFIYVHLVAFGVWILANSGVWPTLPKWDESFVVLGTSASVEAIFLSTFVLISQNRMAAATDKRADLDLQVSLLSEHELTRLVTLTAAIARELGVKSDADSEVNELEQDVAPEAVMDAIEAQSDRSDGDRDVTDRPEGQAAHVPRRTT